ncbi:hypothetical protein LUZ60_001204 [Juncus effusus]|nr:hypothetical protein LUZ60_001204 [Juncus effusus]
MANSILPLLVIFTLASTPMGARILELWMPESDLMTYHGGKVLQGTIPISILWYGKFNSAQQSIISDFILSITSTPGEPSPSVSQWWDTINQLYLSKAGSSGQNQVLLANQESDDYSMGKSLSSDNLTKLATKAGPQTGGIAVVLTAEDVMVEEFCSSHCGVHGSDPTSSWSYIWVGNPATQCPGQCAWPFNQPVNGPQNTPLIPPSGDVGLAGMLINFAKMLAGAVTNADGNGFYQGPQEAPLEACTACPGVYGPGSFPGFAGQLKEDPNTGASYNANGANGRKFLLPGLFDPLTSTCSTLT